jgi:hypothetical protein
MIVIEWRESRKYERWLLRVLVADCWFEVVNPLDPRFWRHIWIMWRGRRVWALSHWMRHLVRRVGPDRPVG